MASGGAYYPPYPSTPGPVPGGSDYAPYPDSSGAPPREYQPYIPQDYTGYAPPAPPGPPPPGQPPGPEPSVDGAYPPAPPGLPPPGPAPPPGGRRPPDQVSHHSRRRKSRRVASAAEGALNRALTGLHPVMLVRGQPVTDILCRWCNLALLGVSEQGPALGLQVGILYPAVAQELPDHGVAQRTACRRRGQRLSQARRRRSEPRRWYAASFSSAAVFRSIIGPARRPSAASGSKWL